MHEDAVLVEIIDENSGKPVPDGAEGEVVVTALSDTGMALLRYRIGDRGYFNVGPCECGSPARLLTLLGRTAQSLDVDSWTISSDQLMGGLAGPGVTDPADCQPQVHGLHRGTGRSARVRRDQPGQGARSLPAGVKIPHHLGRPEESRPRCERF